MTLSPIAAPAQEAHGRVVTLEEALRTARARQPQIRQAQAATEAARARADQALAPYLPQGTATASYQRVTANFVNRPGVLPSGTGGTGGSASLDTFNWWSFGITANQLVYDFGQTSGRYRAARAQAAADAESEHAVAQDVDLAVRVAYFSARAAKSFVTVARESLANQERHLEQIRGFVEQGTRPRIDLIQGQADLATARVQVINADNAYSTAKAQLSQAMGVEGSTDFDVGDETLGPVTGESRPTESLIREALRDRPELAALQAQVRAQELAVRAIEGSYGPSLGVSTGATEAGTQLDHLTWNLSAGVTLSWPFFQGGLTRAQVREARANLVSLRATLDALRLQVRLEVQQATLAVRAATAALAAADEAVTNSRERLRLAEGRYQAGVGSIIELGDAQLALTSAEAQRVQAEFNLSAARAQLVQALGHT